FFFSSRRRHTRLQGDWSSDVCSSDLIGKCRTPGGVDVMCPSFMATREEMHSTRGRTRLLFEMLRGEVITDSWQSDEVMEALDLRSEERRVGKECRAGWGADQYKKKK